jgi:hypothetical protein
MILDVLVTLLWIGSIRWNSQLFVTIWCCPYLLGFRSPLVNVLIGFPYQLVRIHRKINHLNSEKFSQEINILYLELLRFFFLLLGFWNSDLYNLQSGFIWWISFQILVDLLMDCQKFTNEEILNLKFITLIIGTLVESILNSSPIEVILINIQFLLEISIQFPSRTKNDQSS